MSQVDYQRSHAKELYAHALDRNGIAIVFSLLLVLGFGGFALFRTPLCRDLSYDPATNQLRPVKERPYSYAKFQLFWWTIIILNCYTFFYFYTGYLLALNSTCVLLLGGGLATAVFGRMLDNSQIRDNNSQVPTRHQDYNTTSNLIQDILSDEAGVSIHRFQSLIFNVVFGLGFITSFCKMVAARQYPFIEFDTWQLTLLGVSAAGYLGFKTYENSSDTKTGRQIKAVQNTRTAQATTVAAAPAAVAAAMPKQSASYTNLEYSLTSQGLV
jgi:hypothetical protein